MIDRYTTPEMAHTWHPQTKTQFWLDVELAVCEGLEHYHKIPVGTTETIRSRASFDLTRMAELERETRHDVMAFVKNVAEHLKDEGRSLHKGITSYDVVDTTQCMQMRDGLVVIRGAMDALSSTIKRRMIEFRDTPEIGRTHGIHAEPITFGFKLAGWLDEMCLHSSLCAHVSHVISVGKISGAVGIHANVDPQVEAYVCTKLGLRPAPVTTQIISRQRHIQVMNFLAGLASSLERFATEIRNLARTEILEVQEYFAPGQKGSSAMPHKRNPWNCETVTGLARVVRSYTIPMQECATTWHERDLSNSCVERIIIPDSYSLVHWMLIKFNDILDRLIVYPVNMQRNLDMSKGLVYSETLMLALIDKGLSRDEAYTLVQRNAAKVWDSGLKTSFMSCLLIDPDIQKHLSPAEMRRCLNLKHHLRNMDHTFEQFGV